MPSINMIAPRRAEMKRLERDMRRLCIVIVAELALAVVLGGWSGTKLLATRSQIGDMNSAARQAAAGGQADRTLRCRDQNVNPEAGFVEPGERSHDALV